RACDNSRHSIDGTLDCIGTFDEKVVRTVTAAGELAALVDLQVPELRADRGFAQLQQNVVDEAAAQYEAGHAESDRRERQAGPRSLAKDVAERQLEHCR